MTTYTFADRVRVNTSTTGTGTIGLGTAVTGFRTFAQAVTDGNLASGATVYYTLEDGNAWEVGTGTYTAGSPDTLSRAVLVSSSGGATLLSLSGSAQAFISFPANAIYNANITGGSINGCTIGLTTNANANLNNTNVYGNFFIDGYSLGYANFQFNAPAGSSYRGFAFQTSYINRVTLAVQDTASSVEGSSFSTTTSAATASGSNLTLTSMTNVATGQTVAGTNIPAGAYITAISGSVVTLSAAVTGTGVASGSTVTIYRNTGSPFTVSVFGDDGNQLSTPLTIVRNPQQVQITNGSITALYAGSIYQAAPKTVSTSTYTVGSTDVDLMFSVACTVTLPTAATNVGRLLRLSNIGAVAVTSSASNYATLGSTTTTTALLAATSGKYTHIVCDGTKWWARAAN